MIAVREYDGELEALLLLQHILSVAEKEIDRNPQGEEEQEPYLQLHDLYHTPYRSVSLE